MDHLLLLQKRQEDNGARLASLRKEIEAIEIDNHKTGIAIEMLGLVGKPIGQLPQTGPLHKVVTDETDLPREKISVKQLLLTELKNASPLTKMDIVSRLHAAGHKVNSTTVGSLLSKMVGRELEKAGLTAYRPKSEGPIKAGPSGATESEGSLI